MRVLYSYNIDVDTISIRLGDMSLGCYTGTKCDSGEQSNIVELWSSTSYLLK